MGSFSLNRQGCQRTTDEVEVEVEVEAGFDSISSSSSSEVSSILSSESELGDGDDADEATSPGPLQDMSSLMEQLPIKRGLSKFFHGKSQSFTTLSNVRSVEDLAKPENPYNKKLKSCKSYGGLLSQSQGPGQFPRTSSSQRLISKSQLLGLLVLHLVQKDSRLSWQQTPSPSSPLDLPARLVFPLRPPCLPDLIL